MSKVKLSQVADALRENLEDTATMRRILEQLNKVVKAAAAAEDEKPPARKKQFVILLSDPLRQMPAGVEFVGWVLQIPEADSVLSTQERIHQAAYGFNATRRGQKLPVQTVGETLESVPVKALKESELWCKTRTPIFVVVTNNEIPNTPSLFSDEERGIPAEQPTELDIRIEEIVEWAKNAERIGYSAAQRHFKISYNAACSMIETLEKCGYIRKNDAEKYEFVVGGDGKEGA